MGGVIVINERYPADTTIDKSDFDKDVCQRILDTYANTYSSMYDAFSKAARKAIDEGNLKQAKIWWLLSDACSMMLSPGSRNEPFKPYAVSHGRRSAIADDFSEEDLIFFSEIVSEINDIRLKARLADLVWIKAEKKDVTNALIAIDSYRKVSLDADIWVRDGQECWYRAISLALMLRSGAGNRIEEMERDLFQAFDTATALDGYLALWLTNLMSNFGLGKSNIKAISIKLESLARQFENDKDLLKARKYFESSSKWYDLLGDKTKSIEMTVCFAEGYVKEAIARTAIKQPSNVLATILYEKAIQILRTIPKTERPTLRIGERIAELHKLKSEAGQLSLGEMCTLTSDKIDITQFMEKAKKTVSGKFFFDALKEFANLFPGMQISEMEKIAIEEIKQYPLQSLFGRTHISRDGRVIAKTNGVNFNETLTKDRPIVQEFIMRNHKFYVGLVAQGYILPALEILYLEHRIREAVFLDIAQLSPIVPPGRELLFAKGIFAGYDYDYVIALHLLIPQVEHMVRYHLKNAGAKTYTLDNDGIEDENGLSKLVELPEMKSVFGEDLTFEIKALFCDRWGANLRNDLAHGLVDHDVCNSPHGIYTWWFILKLVFNSSWNAARQENETAKEEVENE